MPGSRFITVQSRAGHFRDFDPWYSTISGPVRLAFATAITYSWTRERDMIMGLLHAGRLHANERNLKSFLSGLYCWYAASYVMLQYLGADPSITSLGRTLGDFARPGARHRL